jgi:hypothetical protein
MLINLSVFLKLVDGTEDIKVADQHNGLKTIYEWVKHSCPFIKGDVCAVSTTRGKSVIEVVA